jgi:hypothetical protein
LEHLWGFKGRCPLVGMQFGYTKFCCLLCEWHSGNRKESLHQKQWPKQELFIPGQKNVVSTPLMKPEKIYLPMLHIKCELIKEFIKGMYQNSTGFIYLKIKFRRISDCQIIEVVFVGPQIRELVQEVKFEDQVS